MLGVTAKTISRWENGNYMPDLSLLMPLSEILEVSLQELLSGECIQEEHILGEALLEKTESTLSETLEYSAGQIRKGRKKAIAVVFVALMVMLFFVISMFIIWDKHYFSEVPYQEGDVSQWQGLFPNHSAYELAMGDAGEAVFQDTDAALAKVKRDCSDAIREIQKTYDLLPLAKYTYKGYKAVVGQANLLFRNNERVMEQRELLMHFLDIYENSYEWELPLYVDESGTCNEMIEDMQEQHVIDNSHADFEVTAYEKQMDMTGDGVLDSVTFVMNVTETYKDVTDAYELLRLPFAGSVRVFDGVSGEKIYQSSQISGDRIGNGQYALVSDGVANYLLVSNMNEQMGAASYYYSVYALGEETKQIDCYRTDFLTEDGGYRLMPRTMLRSEVVSDFKSHIEKWFADAELIVSTDVTMDSETRILCSTPEKKVSPTVYYDKVWERDKDFSATFEKVAPEVVFPEDTESVQNKICYAVDNQVAVAKYYDAVTDAVCVFHVNAYTKEDLKAEVDYAEYSYPGEIIAKVELIENFEGESIEICGYKIPFENGEYRKTVMIYWTYKNKVYTLFGEIAADADATSIWETACYVARNMK